MLTLLNAIISRRRYNIVQACQNTVYLLGLFSLTALSNYSKKYYVYFFVALFLIMRVLEIVTISATTEGEGGDMTLEKHRHFSFEAIFAYGTFVMSVLLYSPDLKTTTLIYTPIFLVGRVCQLLIRYDMTQIDNVLWYAEETSMMTMSTILMFYI